jgi:predicted RNase H-like nuclease (RuvC/YqgF family)
MSDHIPDATKMIGETARTDAEWEFDPTSVDGVLDWSRQLERELNSANARIRLLIAERDTARRQADQNYKLREEFRELLGTDDVEQGVAVVREMKERIKRLEEALKSIQKYWNLDSNEGAMNDACWHAINTASEALEAKEDKP